MVGRMVGRRRVEKKRRKNFVLGSPNKSHPSIPNNMTIGGELVNSHEIAEHFAGFFDKKVVTIVSETIINPMVNKR